MASGECHQPVQAIRGFFNKDFLSEATTAHAGGYRVSSQAEDVVRQHRGDLERPRRGGGGGEVSRVNQELKIENIGDGRGRQFGKAHIDRALEATRHECFKNGLSSIGSTLLRRRGHILVQLKTESLANPGD